MRSLAGVTEGGPKLGRGGRAASPADGGADVAGVTEGGPKLGRGGRAALLAEGGAVAAGPERGAGNGDLARLW